MKVIRNLKHINHRPDWELYKQKMTPHCETAERIIQIENALAKLKNIEYENPKEYSIDIISRIHTPEFIGYIKDVSGLAIDTEDYRAPYVIPPAALTTKFKTRHIDEVAYYAMDTTSPIGRHTFDSAVHSAFVGYTGAELILAGEKIVYALCRPPGHHSETNRYGGYCYFNNAAIAAEKFVEFGKVTILDIDFHHGNGTQTIFYERADVQYVSLHGDPLTEYPHYTGFEDECGAGKGLGYNINIPLAKDTDNAGYLSALTKAVEHINRFKCEFLILSLGVDTFIDDPIGGFKMTMQVYPKIGELINQIATPKLILQEGGYNTGAIGELVVSVLQGFGIY